MCDCVHVCVCVCVCVWSHSVSLKKSAFGYCTGGALYAWAFCDAAPTNGGAFTVNETVNYPQICARV